nr:immunoglobulin heavy chain junction region [Mus musculus]
CTGGGLRRGFPYW